MAKLIVERRNQETSSGLTVKTLNTYLDVLADTADKLGQLSIIFSEARNKEIKWVIAIIVKDSGLCFPTSSDQFAPFNTTPQDHRFYSIDSMKIQSMLRKRKVDFMLACKFTVTTLLRKDTSVKLDLSLEKVICKSYSSSVSQVYTIYDEDRATLEAWVCETKEIDASPPSLTSLIAKAFKSRGTASNFCEDAILISKVLTQGVGTLQISAPPEMFRLHAFFLQHSEEAEDFPNTVAITTLDQASVCVFQVRTWDRKRSNKTCKGILFIFGKSTCIGAVDMTLVNCNDQFWLPSCFAEGIKRWCDMGDIPEPIKMVIEMVTKITAAPEDSIKIQDTYADGMVFEPHLILDAPGSVVPWIEALEIEHFLEKVCYVLAKNIQEAARGVADPDTEVRRMFHMP